ncbi:papain-like cysteine protease family protein [Paraburkholderia sp. CI3]|uniref:papain-like cysteine protease family protein n=1 Tax=Paraburkholderia sp. CI3 TaxID=2991060 RepID=UPI003D1F4EFF
MAMVIGRHVSWRFQGVKSCCWLTCIEMLMHCKYSNIYGRNQTAHSARAMEEFRANAGSNIYLHADHYGLATNAALDSPMAGLHEWSLALRSGPVLAEGDYGWARFGIGAHVILITGISRSGKLIYMNPNVFAVMPHPQSKETYIAIKDVYRLRAESYGLGGPFWQVAEDLPARPPRLAVDLGAPNWGASVRNQLGRIAP